MSHVSSLMSPEYTHAELTPTQPSPFPHVGVRIHQRYTSDRKPIRIEKNFSRKRAHHNSRPPIRKPCRHPRQSRASTSAPVDRRPFNPRGYRNGVGDPSLCLCWTPPPPRTGRRSSGWLPYYSLQDERQHVTATYVFYGRDRPGRQKTRKCEACNQNKKGGTQCSNPTDDRQHMVSPGTYGPEEDRINIINSDDNKRR